MTDTNLQTTTPAPDGTAPTPAGTAPTPAGTAPTPAGTAEAFDIAKVYPDVAKILGVDTKFTTHDQLKDYLTKSMAPAPKPEYNDVANITIDGNMISVDKSVNEFAKKVAGLGKLTTEQYQSLLTEFTKEKVKMTATAIDAEKNLTKQMEEKFGVGKVADTLAGIKKALPENIYNHLEKSGVLKDVAGVEYFSNLAKTFQETGAPKTMSGSGANGAANNVVNAKKQENLAWLIRNDHLKGTLEYIQKTQEVNDITAAEIKDGN